MKLNVVGHLPKSIKLRGIVGEGGAFRHLYSKDMLTSTEIPQDFRVYILAYNTLPYLNSESKSYVKVLNIGGREMQDMSLDEDIELIEIVDMTVRRFPA